MVDNYDGLKTGDRLSQLELQKQNIHIYNKALTAMKTGKLSLDQTEEYQITNATHFFEQLGLGLLPDRSVISKFGRIEAVGSIAKIISALGIYGTPATADTVVATSSNVNDAFPAGTGARVIRIWGVDINSAPISEDLNIGATSVNRYLRVFKARVINAGTITPINGGNKGNVTITQTGGTQMVVIPTFEGSTLCACYHVPAGYTALIWYADTTAGEGKDSLNRLKIRDITLPNAPFTTEGIRENFQNQVGRKFTIPSKVAEKHDIIFTAISSASGTAVEAVFLIELVKN